MTGSRRFPAQSILIVTHNIEEAVLLEDRVVILRANLGCIRREVVIDLPRPHDRANARFKVLVDCTYAVMTHPEADVATEPTGGAMPKTTEQANRSPYAQPLPHARVGGISGLLELIGEQPEGRHDLPMRSSSSTM